jgi:predicted lipoprotein
MLYFLQASSRLVFRLLASRPHGIGVHHAGALSTKCNVQVAAVCILCASAFLLSCNQQPQPSQQQSGFDRTAFLRDMGTNLIIPAYRETQSRIATLQASIQTFAQMPTEQTLQAAQAAWLAAYRVWLRSAPFDFGPAETTFGTLRENIAVFPVNPRLTEQFIAENRTDLNNFNRDTRGLHGIEYLLFARPTSETLSAFAGTNGASRRQYLLAITNDIKNRVDVTANRWLAEQNGYLQEFVRSNGTAIGTSTSMLFNEFVKSYEELKNFKIGVPFGLRAGQTAPAPHNLEGFYSQRSLEFMQIHLQVIEDIWAGKATQADGSARDFLGFEEYLVSVAGGRELVTSTKTQLAALKSALNAVPTSPTLAMLISSNHPSLPALHTEAQKMTRFFKSDMSSLLGISITFSSGDGD